jgi:chromate transporter
MNRFRELFDQARDFIAGEVAELSAANAGAGVDLRSLVRAFLKVGTTGFGGGIAVIAQIRRLVVREKRWLSENEFLDAVSLAQSLPGANAVNAITYIGLKAAGLKGALVSVAGFILPSFLMMVGLAVAHGYLKDLPDAQRVFQGFNAAVVGLIAATVVRLGKTAMQRQWHLEMGVAAGFILIFTNTSVAEVVLLAGIGGIFIHSFKSRARQRVRRRLRKERQEAVKEVKAEQQARQQAAEIMAGADGIAGKYHLDVTLPEQAAPTPEPEKPADGPVAADGASAPPRKRTTGSLRAVAWPLALMLALPFLSKFVDVWNLMTIFLRIGTVTFGGGFVMIPQIETDVVEINRWLTRQEFADGMAFGQITPGPVMITATFIGYKVAGVVGAVAATVAAFLPSFVMTCVAGSSLNRFRTNYLVQSFLSGVAPAVVGMLAAAGVSLARSGLGTSLSFGIATLAFLLMLRATLNPVFIIFGCGLAQWAVARGLLKFVSISG